MSLLFFLKIRVCLKFTLLDPRFITLIDIIYDKDIPVAVTANQNLSQFTSSQSLEKQFKRTVSRLYELTSIEYK